MNALVANAKSPTALSIMRSLGSKNIKISGATDSKNDCAIYSKFCKNRIFLKSDPRDIEGRVEELLKIVKNNKFDVFLPVLSEEVLGLLSKQKEEFENYTRLPIPDFNSFDLFDNKSKTIKLAQSNDIPCPDTHFVENYQQLNEIKNTIEYPVLIKPNKGERSTGIENVTNSSDLISGYRKVKDQYGPCHIQRFITGQKYAAVFIVNRNSEPKRFFVHKCIREYPITGGPICFLKSVRYDLLFEYGLRLLRAAKYYGLAQIEFIVDEKDMKPKITEVNPRFYGCLQGAAAAGVNFPYALFKMAIDGNIEADFTYKLGVKCRNLLFNDTKHLLSVLRGQKTPKYKIGKLQTLFNYFKFHEDNAYFILSKSDPMPALVKIYGSFIDELESALNGTDFGKKLLKISS